MNKKREETNMPKLIYLASPATTWTSGLDEESRDRVLELRGIAATYAKRRLMNEGRMVYSPVLYWTLPFLYEIMQHNDWPHERVMDHCYTMLERSDELFVLELPGWKESSGIAQEMAWAQEANMSKSHIFPGRYVPQDILEELDEHLDKRNPWLGV
tara:strand:+ start:9391 stop:9858 length:468 start_codon:yes stop_codon:yes gene_type:complete